ncbi:hypothetical protein [Spiroplasma floricola]|uniref:Uncharacterized protein n=1 Tax=Spiroplasma floricola 23-6 TaxID=1336749 RepID=A0A2K8SDG4_9MOLU|nr:hypothetical protein [Spiroplasma floricola]AUB31501.1 hypothetical protein SFLOR_v1c04490 [Spiroplasma floricola 23-6]
MIAYKLLPLKDLYRKAVETMGFDNNRDNFRRSRNENGSRDSGRSGGSGHGGDRGGRFGGRGRDNGGRSGGQGGNSGRIDNFEKPLLELLKEINEKLDLLIKK